MTALFVGNWHVPRTAQVAALRDALAGTGRAVVAIGSALLARSPRNPFTWEERAAMLREALPQDARARIVFEPLRERWDAERMREDIAAIAARHGAKAETVTQQDLRGLQSDDELRDLLWTAETPELALAAIEPQVPPAVTAFIAGFMRSPMHERLRGEWQQIAAERRAWSVAPYPVVLVTVDAVVRAASHVLLIRRGRAPGQGLAALPGGFLDPAETVLDASIRELLEETRLDVPLERIRASRRAVRVFDHPRRSQRNRVVTHAHFFDLADAISPPRVEGGDDAASAQWVPIDRLAAMEAELMDDHFHVLDTFLHLLH